MRLILLKQKQLGIHMISGGWCHSSSYPRYLFHDVLQNKHHMSLAAPAALSSYMGSDLPDPSLLRQKYYPVTILCEWHTIRKWFKVWSLVKFTLSSKCSERINSQAKWLLSPLTVGCQYDLLTAHNVSLHRPQWQLRSSRSSRLEKIIIEMDCLLSGV